jgi:uncharacterized phage protein (TIGR01671 family)
MREYLFRGKRKDNGKWVEGYYIYDESGQITEEPAAYICRLNKHPCGWSLIPYEVFPESVGEWTGLADKNGRKIFEGDIIQRAWDGYPTIYRVVFDKFLAAFIGEVKPYGQFTTFDGDGEYFEIIGTVFENADLLEG